MQGFLVIFAFVGLFVLGFPVVLAIGIPCAIYLVANDIPVDLLAQRTLYALDSFPLVAVPVFLFVGSVMNSAGISKYIYRFADTLVGRCREGWRRSISSAASSSPACPARRSPTSAASAGSRSMP